MYSEEEPVQERRTVEPSRLADSEETVMTDPNMTSFSMVSEPPMSSITVSETVCTPPTSRTSTDCPASPTPSIVQNQVTISPSGADEPEASKLAIAPGIGGCGDAAQNATGGRFGMVTFCEAELESPQGSLADTVTLHSWPGSSLEAGTSCKPSRSGTWNPFLDHR